MSSFRLHGFLGTAVLLLLCTGCVRGCKSSRPPIHPNPNMDYQEKYQPQEASNFFYDGSAMRPEIAGTVARGELPGDPVVTTGYETPETFVASIPIAIDDGMLARGENRYAIYCTPCHDNRGNGQGILYQRGNVPTANLHDAKYLEYPDGQMFDVITNGFGLMKGYRYPLSTEDRWSVVAYVRRLQQEKLQREAALAGGSTGETD